MAELHRRRFTTMFTTDTAFQIRTDSTAFLCSHTYQLTHTILIENLERIYFQNLLFQINRKERSDIVAKKLRSYLKKLATALTSK